MEREITVRFGGDTYEQRAEKNAQGMEKLINLLRRNMELSISDLEWIGKHQNASDAEIADYIKERAAKDDGEF
jgi:hypothetical protein